MECLKRDFMAESNRTQSDQTLERFKLLHADIEGYVGREIPGELVIWNKPFSDLSLGIVLKESIGRLEDIICKYDSH
jgi:catalase (peroxidase I)